MALRAAEVETLFTANVDQVVKAEQTIKQTGQRVEKNPLKVKADAKEALDGMDRVEAQAKRLVSKDTLMTVDANIERGEKSLDRVQKRLDYLRSVETTMDVKADIARAEASLSKVQRNLDGLKAARATMEVDADTSGADAALKQLPDTAKGAGDDAGKGLVGSLDAATRGAGERVGAAVGDGVEETLIKALSAIPVAGGIVLAGVAIGKAITSGIQDGLAVEVRYDRLQALTGIDEETAQRLGNAAGEAYANNFGASIESNMDATRLALQFRILDPTATTRDTQLVIQGLTGIADVLGEDVEPVARAVTQMLRTGLVSSAQQAFDVIAVGAREGVNIGQDLLDTFNEYGTQFRKLGLDGPQALGLLSQGLRAGARDSDVAADALKEFAIRAVDPAMKQGFEDVGFSWDDLSQRIAQGGTVAAAALDETLDRIREMPDPAEQAAAAMTLFGTQSEDMAAALLSMDLTTAVDQLGEVQGAAQKMFDTLSSNDASKIEQAQRNIEVAAEGIKGALAQAFADPLAEGAEWISQNRGPVLQFFSDLINGAIDFGITATESFGSFVSGPLADIVEGMKHIIKIMNPFADTSDLEGFINGMRDFEDTTDGVVDKLEGMRDEFNGFADGQIALGYVNDAALRTADSISQVGLAVDGSRLSIEGLDTANLSASESGRALQEQLDAASQSLLEEYEAALLAGESQENLKGRYDATAGALMGQLTAMGLTQEQAQALIDTVLQTPETAYTVYSSNASAEAALVDGLNQKIVQLPDGNFIIVTDTSPAQRAIDEFLAANASKRVNIATGLGGTGGITRAYGGPIWGPGGPRDDIIPVMASNGEHMLTAAEVNAMGGHDAVFRFRRMAMSGALRLADGGPVVKVPDYTWRLPQYPEPVVVTQASAAAPAPQQSLVGLRIEGEFTFDQDGVVRIVDGRIVEAIRTVNRSTGGRR